MFRLIWAELKKTLINRKMVIAITCTLLFFIIIYTFTFRSAIKYNYPSYGIEIGGSSQSPYENKSGDSAVEIVLSQMEQRSSGLEQLISDTENIKNEEIKPLLISIYQSLPARYNAAYKDLVNAIYDTGLLDDYNYNDGLGYGKIYTVEQLDAFFDTDGAYVPLIKLMENLRDEINQDDARLTALNRFLYMKRDDRFNGYYYGRLFNSPLFDMINSGNIDFWVDWYESSKAELSEKDLEMQFSNYVANFVNSYGYYEKYEKEPLVNEDDINSIVASVNDSISVKLSEKGFNEIKKIVISNKNSAIGRMAELTVELQKFRGVPSLSKLQSDEIVQIDSRHNRLYGLASSYVGSYITYHSLENFTDSELKDYVIPDITNKYNLKQRLTATPYILENGLFPLYSNGYYPEGYLPASTPFAFFSIFMDAMTGSDLSHDLNSYINFVFSFLAVVFIVICVVLGGGSIAGELQRGTIKMLIIRPYKRWKILTAKILSTLIISFALIVLSLILLIFIGWVFFGYTFTLMPVFAIFNASKVVIMSPIGELILKIFFLFISIIIYTLIATLFSAILRSRTTAVIVALLLNLFGGIITLILSHWPPIKFFIFNNADLYTYWGQGPMLGDMTFYLSAAVCILHAALFTFLTYYFFTKKDLN